jgi:hypothetical protein
MPGTPAAGMMEPVDRRGPIPRTKGANVFTNLTAPAGRRLGRIAAVGAVALVLAGAMASPAEARTREEKYWNNCFESGGQPFTIEGGAYQPDEYVCDYGDGDFESEYAY